MLLDKSVVFESNSCMAILGDKVFGLIITEEHFKKDDSKGAIQNHISRIASNENLFAIGKALKLDGFLWRDPGDTGPVSKNVMAVSVEAVIGAVYLEGSLDAAKRMISGFGLN